MEILWYHVPWLVGGLNIACRRFASVVDAMLLGNSLKQEKGYVKKLGDVVFWCVFVGVLYTWIGMAPCWL